MTWFWDCAAYRPHTVGGGNPSKTWQGLGGHRKPPLTWFFLTMILKSNFGHFLFSQGVPLKQHVTRSTGREWVSLIIYAIREVLYLLKKNSVWTEWKSFFYLDGTPIAYLPEFAAHTYQPSVSAKIFISTTKFLGSNCFSQKNNYIQFLFYLIFFKDVYSVIGRANSPIIFEEVPRILPRAHWDFCSLPPIDQQLLTHTEGRDGRSVNGFPI